MNSSTDNVYDAFNKFQEVVFYGSLILLVLGLPGNILMFIVFSSKNLRKLSVSTYYRAMSIFSLYMTINWIRQFLTWEFNFYLWNVSHIMCKFGMFSIYTTRGILSWYLVVIGIDRFIAIAYPIRFKFIITYPFPILAVVILALYNSGIYFYTFFDFKLVDIDDDTNSTYFNCDLSSDYMTFATNIIDLVNTVLMPFFIMLALSIATIVTIVKSRARMGVFEKKGGVGGNGQANRCRHRDARFARTTLVFNMTFFICTSPIPIAHFLNDSYPIFFSSGLGNFISFISIFLYYLFFSVAFYIQLVANSLVRASFIRIINSMSIKTIRTNKASTNVS